MDAPLPPKPEIVVSSGIEFSSNSLPNFLDSESESESEGTRARKSLTVNQALEALKTLNTLSTQQLPEFEKKAEEYAQIREKAIVEQQKTNQMLLQLSQHLDKFHNKEAEIQQLQKRSDDHEECLITTHANIQTIETKLNDLFEHLTFCKEKIENLQTQISETQEIAALSHSKLDIQIKKIESNKEAYVTLGNNVESLRKMNQSLLRRVQIYMTGSVAILMAAVWIWWHAYQK